MSLRLAVICLPAILLGSCGGHQPAESKLTVAAAANLTGVFQEMGRAFLEKTGTEVVLSFGSTAQLAQQIDNGAPFDVFAAADTEHVDSLVKRSKLMADTRVVYATGQLALWSPGGIQALKDLDKPAVRFVAVAQPELAPYGRASLDALKNAGLWAAVSPKIVYAMNINQAKQMAESGNADACFTAYSLVIHERGSANLIDPKLYQRIDQGMAVVTSTSRPELARRFEQFVLGPDGRAILKRNGYL